MAYRNPDTGRFMTREAWESLQGQTVEEYEDYDDLENWDSFEDEEMY